MGMIQYKLPLIINVAA